MFPPQNLDFDERYPIYQQIVSHFSRSLVRGEINPGDRIPSIRELAMALKVNTNTIQRSYHELERNELIYSQRGTGYFVMNNEQIVERVRKTMVSRSMSLFLDEMRSLGYSDEEILSELKSQILNKGGESIDTHDNKGS